MTAQVGTVGRTGAGMAGDAVAGGPDGYVRGAGGERSALPSRRGQVWRLLSLFLIAQAVALGGGTAFAGPAPQPKCYERMAALVDANHLPSEEGAPNISKALLMCIFWEESSFTNTRERGGPAVGFGQVNAPFLSAFLGVLKKHTSPGPVKEPIDYTADAVLKDDAFSVQVASAVTKFNLTKEGGSVQRALNLYATGKANVTSEHVPAWQQCAAALEAEAWENGVITLNPDEAAVAAALDKATSFRKHPVPGSAAFDTGKCSMH